jgi:heptosyltransferase-2
MVVKVDCRFFRGDVPCKPHKEEGVHCEQCPYYTPTKKRILIIKLGAIGDVIRTTPLLRKLRQVYPQGEISWLTNYPEVIPSDVDRVYKFDLKDILTLLATPFDVLYNLDKDNVACSLANILKADLKKGFYLNNGKCNPLDNAAYHKWLTGIFDDISRQNTKSYPEEIFEICGFKFDKEEYILNEVDSDAFKHLKKKDYLIGLNTGCGSRWSTRLWPEEYWIELAKKLTNTNKDADVILIGGPEEDEKNKGIAKAAQCIYPGYFPIKTFGSLVQNCDLIITGVTMALHIAIGLKKKIVLLNNVFNKNEFELYNLGIIIEPDIDCLGCYKTSCEKECMRLIKPDTVVEACKSLLLLEKAIVRDSRIASRQPVNFNIEFSVTRENLIYPSGVYAKGTIVNISEKGFGLITDYPLKKGHAIKIKHSGNKCVPLYGIVNWNARFTDSFKVGLSIKEHYDQT